MQKWNFTMLCLIYDVSDISEAVKWKNGSKKNLEHRKCGHFRGFEWRDSKAKKSAENVREQRIFQDENGGRCMQAQAGQLFRGNYLMSRMEQLFCSIECVNKVFLELKGPVEVFEDLSSIVCVAVF